MCGEGCSSNSHLIHHLKKHYTDQASWDEYLSQFCPGAVVENECETCKKIFASKSGLKSHIYHCKGPKGPVNVPICKTCNKVFRDNYNLKKHTNAQCCNGRMRDNCLIGRFENREKKIANKSTNYAEVEKNISVTDGVDNKPNILSEHQDFAEPAVLINAEPKATSHSEVEKNIAETDDADNKTNIQSGHQDFDEPTVVINAEHKETNYSEVEQNVSETDGVGRKRKNQSEDQESAKKQRLEDGSEAIEKTIQIVINVKIL